MGQPTHVCRLCEYVGRPERITKGSILIEIVLWLFLILPGIIYSIWRLTSRYKACPMCGQESMIPLHSPAGRRLAQRRSQTRARPARG